MLANVGTTELIVIAVIIFLFLNSNKLKKFTNRLNKSTENNETKKESLSEDE